ncbi:MAG: ABC transporter permease [Chloroflexota bacterium]|nr:ABC transporter permease [Chloroflexota bacterium]
MALVASSPLVKGYVDLGLPLATYGALVQGSILSINGLVDTIVNATPLILVGLAVGLGFKAGLFNIGGQGQFLIGAVASAAAGAALSQSSPVIAIPLALLAGMAAGALYGFIPGFLKAFTGAHEVVTTIMLNYVAIYVVAYLITGPLRQAGASFAVSPDVGAARLPAILNVGTGHAGHVGILIPLLVVPTMSWLLYRSTIGFEIRTVGANPDAALYAGMRPRRLVVLALTLGGLLAGLAGAVEILGVSGNMPAAYSTNIGFDAITVALLGRANPVGIVFGGLLLGAMRAGAPLMETVADVPRQMVDVLQGIILFFLAADVVVRRVFRIRAAGVGVDELQTVTRSYGGQTTPP